MLHNRLIHTLVFWCGRGDMLRARYSFERLMCDCMQQLFVSFDGRRRG